MSQSSEPSSAFSDTWRHVDGQVKIVRFLPQTLRLFGLADVLFEDSETADGIGKIERVCLWLRQSAKASW